MGGVKDIIEDISADDIRLTVNIAKGLFAAGNEILELIDKNNKISNVDLLAIIEKQDVLKNIAKQAHLDAINES